MTAMTNLKDSVLAQLDMEITNVDDRVQLVNTMFYNNNGMLNAKALALLDDCIDVADDCDEDEDMVVWEECNIFEILADYILGE